MTEKSSSTHTISISTRAPILQDDRCVRRSKGKHVHEELSTVDKSTNGSRLAWLLILACFELVFGMPALVMLLHCRLQRSKMFSHTYVHTYPVHTFKEVWELRNISVSLHSDPLSK